MMSIPDKTKYGRLTFIESLPHGKWAMLCDCGTRRELPSANVRRGLTKSCGCYRRQWAADQKRTHGMTGTPTYQIWQGMKRRCDNPNTEDYRNYGGRGIRVCDRWQTFEPFLSDMGLQLPGLTIDRIDVNGHYSPENCRWATMTEQQNNRRNTRRVLFDGAEYTLTELMAKLGCLRSTARRRVGLDC